MADVSDDLKEWSTTAASNAPSGSATIGTGLDDNLREIQKVVRQDLAHKGADIASVAGTTDIGAVPGLMHDITGTEVITGLGTVSAGIWKILKFEAAATLTHNATSLILPGAANIVTANGDVGIFMSEGSGNWRCLTYTKANGRHLGPLLLTEQASTSGTSIDFTGIPSWVTKIIIQFVGVSTSGTSNPIIQLGDGAAETSGYLGASTTMDSTAPTTANFTAGFGLNIANAANVVHGTVTITLEDSANFTWVASGVLGLSNTAAMILTAGSKSLSSALDRVRITTAGGSDTFDAGAINVICE